MRKFRSKWLAGALIPAIVLGTGPISAQELTPEQLLLLQQQQQQEQQERAPVDEPTQAEEPPVEEPPVEEAPVEEPAPVEEAPVEEPAPADEPAQAEDPPIEEPAPAETAPAEEPAQAEETPAEEPAQAEETPAEDAPVEETAPVEAPTQAEDPSIEEPAPAEEVPAEEPAQAEETPAEDAPVEETAPVEAPAQAEDAPAEQPAAEDQPAADAPAGDQPEATADEPAPAPGSAEEELMQRQPETAPESGEPAEAPAAEEAPAEADEAADAPATTPDAPAAEAPAGEAPAEANPPADAAPADQSAPTEAAPAAQSVPAEANGAELREATPRTDSAEDNDDRLARDAASALLGAAAGAAAAAILGPTLEAPRIQGVPEQIYVPRDDRYERYEADDLGELRRERRERRDGNRIIIEEPGGRTIIRDGDRTIIIHNEQERLTDFGEDVRRIRRDGNLITVVERPNGVEIITVTDEDGYVLRRLRRDPDGREYILFDNGFDTPRGDRFEQDYFVELPPPRITIPREAYIVEARGASPEVIYETFAAPPVVPVVERYTLQEVVNSPTVLDRVRRVDVNSITFRTGSWTVEKSEIPALDGLARAINTVLKQDPNEVFLVEGHTDAVGAAVDNLSLSDRRAEEVAYLLTQYYGVPPENLTTKGYGESQLKVQTSGPSEANRRVTLRRITPLLEQSASRE